MVLTAGGRCERPLPRWREHRRRRAVEALQQEVGLSFHRMGEVHDWSVKELVPWLEEQLAPLLEQQTQISHERSTWRFVLQMLIASHSNPEQLLRNWNANLPMPAVPETMQAFQADERTREQNKEAFRQQQEELNLSGSIPRRLRRWWLV